MMFKLPACICAKTKFGSEKTWSLKREFRVIENKIAATHEVNTGKSI